MNDDMLRQQLRNLSHPLTYHFSSDSQTKSHLQKGYRPENQNEDMQILVLGKDQASIIKFITGLSSPDCQDTILQLLNLGTPNCMLSFDFDLLGRSPYSEEDLCRFDFWSGWEAGNRYPGLEEKQNEFCKLIPDTALNFSGENITDFTELFRHIKKYSEAIKTVHFNMDTCRIGESVAEACNLSTLSFIVPGTKSTLCGFKYAIYVASAEELADPSQLGGRIATLALEAPAVCIKLLIAGDYDKSCLRSIAESCFEAMMHRGSHCAWASSRAAELVDVCNLPSFDLFGHESDFVDFIAKLKWLSVCEEDFIPVDFMVSNVFPVFSSILKRKGGVAISSSSSAEIFKYLNKAAFTAMTKVDWEALPSVASQDMLSTIAISIEAMFRFVQRMSFATSEAKNIERLKEVCRDINSIQLAKKISSLASRDELQQAWASYQRVFDASAPEDICEDAQDIARFLNKEE